MPATETKTAAEAKDATALASAKTYIAEASPLITKIATALRTVEAMTVAQKANAVGAFRNAYRTASTLRTNVRAELRSTIRTAADGDEVSDDYADAAEALSAIVNLAETALDSLDEDVSEAPAEKSDESEQTATEAEASDKEASDKEAAETEASDKEAAEEDDDKGSKKEASLIEAGDAAIIQAALDASAPAKTAGSRTANDALTSLLDGLKNLIDGVESQMTGEGDTVVNLDENGVVQDDPSVSDILNEDSSDPSMVPTPGDDQGGFPGDPAPSPYDEDIHAALMSLEAAGNPFTAAADPYSRPSKDPLADKGAIKASARPAARRDNQFDTDVHNLSLIAADLVR